MVHRVLEIETTYLWVRAWGEETGRALTKLDTQRNKRLGSRVDTAIPGATSPLVKGVSTVKPEVVRDSVSPFCPFPPLARFVCSAAKPAPWEIVYA
jgi:hypothetical protein